MISKTILDNGLSIIFLQDPSASVVTTRLLIKAGSIYEAPHLGSGKSHFLEHLIAGGATSQASEADYKARISMMGGAYNAYTSIDHTAYYINTTPNYLCDAIQILSEWGLSAEFSQEAFNREYDVICKEIEKNLADVDRAFYHVCQQHFYKHHPISYPVIGFLDHFKQLTLADLKTYYQSFYVPSNMVLIVGGNFQLSPIKEHIQTCFGHHARQAAPLSYHLPEPPPFSKKVLEKTFDMHVTYLSLRFSTVPLFSSLMYPLDLIDYILSNGEDSLLHDRLVEKKKLAYSVQSYSYTPSMTTGYFEITVECDYQHIEAIQNEIFETLQSIQKGDFHTDLIKRAKKQKLSEDIFSISNIEEHASKIAHGYFYSQSIHFHDTYLSHLKQVKKKDMIDAACQFFDTNRAVTTVMSPPQKETTPQVSTLKKEKVSLPQKVTLPHGARVIFFHKPDLPKVHCHLVCTGGIRHETASNNGIGSLTSHLLGKQSRLYSKQDLLHLIENNGASMQGGLGNNTFYYSLDCLSDDLKVLLPAFLDSFFNPVFTLEDLTEGKRKLTQQIKTRPDHWLSYGLYQFNQHFFQSHPYALSLLGEIDPVQTLTCDALSCYHQQLLDPKQMVFSVFGDFNQTETLDQIQAFLKDYSFPSSISAPPLSSPPLYKKKQFKTLALQQELSAFFMGFNGCQFKNQEAFNQLQFLTAVLVGHQYPNGRLHDQLREAGLVYLVHGANRPGIEHGVFLIYALSNRDKEEQVQDIIYQNIDALKKTPISQSEFDCYKAQLSFYNQDRLSCLSSFSFICAIDELYDLGFDHYQKGLSFLSHLSPEQVTEDAKTWLKAPQCFLFK